MPLLGRARCKDKLVIIGQMLSARPLTNVNATQDRANFAQLLYVSAAREYRARSCT